jgi:Ca2+-binding EF-hand superfamily protein
MRDADIDGDGEISYKEFYRLMTRVNNKRNSDPSKK